MTDVTSNPEPDRVTAQSSAEVELHDDLTVSPHSEAQGSSVSTLALKQHTIGDREAGAQGSQSSTSSHSSPVGEATGSQPRHTGMSLVPMQSMESLESGMSSSNSEESLQAFGHAGGVSRESFVLRRPTKQRKRLPESVHPVQPTILLNPMATSDLSPSEDEETEEEDYWSRDAFYQRSFRITAEDLEESDTDEDLDAELDALLEGAIDGRIKERAKRALKVALEEVDNIDKYMQESQAAARFPTTEPPIPPELRVAKKIGSKMAQNFLFPATLKVMQDVWVAIELMVTLFEFVFACVTFGDGGAANIIFVLLSVINLALASTDGFLHYVEGGSCKACFKSKKKQQKVKKENKSSCTSCLTDKQKRLISTGSEVVRLILTEILLYPLVVLDLMELIESETYRGGDANSLINFGLFNIGILYLVLTVYFIRIFMSISSMISMNRLPKTTTSSYTSLMNQLSLHLIGQIIVHILVLLMVAAKINSEKCTEAIEGSGSNGTSEEETSINISPFLYTTLFTGDIIPILGFAIFFVLNFPRLKQLSMGLFIEIFSIIVQEDFAGTAFKGKGVRHVNRKVRKAQEKINIRATRQQFSEYVNFFTLKNRVGYWLKNPIVVSLSFVHCIFISTFLVCHTLGRSDPCNSDSNVEFLGNRGTVVTFILGAVVLLVANFQVILISSAWVLIIAGLLLFIATMPFLAVVIVPLLLFLGVLYICIKL